MTKLFAHLFCLKIEIVKVILDENFNYQVRRHHSPDPHGISMEWQVLNGKKWMESKKRRVESIAGFWLGKNFWARRREFFFQVRVLFSLFFSWHPNDEWVSPLAKKELEEQRRIPGESYFSAFSSSVVLVNAVDFNHTFSFGSSFLNHNAF